MRPADRKDWLSGKDIYHVPRTMGVHGDTYEPVLVEIVNDNGTERIRCPKCFKYCEDKGMPPPKWYAENIGSPIYQRYFYVRNTRVVNKLVEVDLGKTRYTTLVEVEVEDV